MLSHTHMEVLLKQKGEGSKLPRFDCFGLHFNEKSDQMGDFAWYSDP